MQIQFLDYRDKKATHIVRVMSPMGVYPSKSIALGESGLYISDDICFSVVEYFSDDPEPNDYYSEVEWATSCHLLPSGGCGVTSHFYV